MLKSYLLHEDMTVRETAVVFLTFIVQQYASPAKIFARSQQFENAVRQSLLRTDFVSILFHMISQPDLPRSLLTAIFSCLSQYTNEIALSGDECVEILVATNTWLSKLLPSTHCLCFSNVASSPSPDLDPLLIAICKTLSAHFTTLSRVMVQVSSLCNAVSGRLLRPPLRPHSPLPQERRRHLCRAPCRRVCGGAGPKRRGEFRLYGRRCGWVE